MNFLPKSDGMEGNVDSRLQVHLKEDGCRSTMQNWVKTGGLWSMLY